MDYDEYERMCEEEIEKNKKYLAIFKEDLEAKELSEKTIRKHMRNAEFYINDFLLHYEILSMERGAQEVDAFLGDFAILKCVCTSPTCIKENASSLKKFYECMLNHNYIKQEDYNLLVTIINEQKEDWIEYLKAF